LGVHGEPVRLYTNLFLYTGIFTLYLFVGSHSSFKNPFVDFSAPTKLAQRVINTLICIHENENSNINNSDTILGVYIHYKLLISGKKEYSHEKMSGAIQNISRKSLSELMEWKKSNPEYEDMDSEFSKMCINIQTQSVGTANKDKLYHKIINNVATEEGIKAHNDEILDKAKSGP